MKKITSLFAALMAVVAVNAATVTFGSADLSTSAMTKSGVTVTPAKAPSSSTNNAINTFEGVKTLRIYADATLTIDAGTNKITSVTLKLNSATNGKRLTTMTSDAGEVTVKGNPDWTATWTNEGVNKVVFTVGEKATLGSEATKAGQIHIMEIIVVTDGEGGSEGGDDPTTKELVPEYAQAEYYGTDWQILMDDSDEEGLGASFIMYLDFFNESATQIAGTWKNFDAKYTALYTIAGTDTTLVDYTDLTLELTWMQTIDMSDIFEGYTQCGVYKINVNYTGADNVLYTIKDAILPIFTLDYSGEVADFINVTDALEDVEAMNIRVADGAIMLNADAPVQVYSVSGQLLYFATAKGEMTINGMPKNQALIVRIGDKAAKVIL